VKAGNVLEYLVLLVGHIARLLTQLTIERMEERGVVVAERPERLGEWDQVEPNEMCLKGLGKRRSQVNAPARGGIRIEHDQQILVAH
jgi:hypothetical protein